MGLKFCISNKLPDNADAPGCAAVMEKKGDRQAFTYTP